MEEKLLLTLAKRRCYNGYIDNFPIKILIIREIFHISDISNELLRILLLVCGVNEDDIILKLFTFIDNTYITCNQGWFFSNGVYFRDLDLKSVKDLCKVNVYFLQELGFNFTYSYVEYNAKIDMYDFDFSPENSFLFLLKNKIKFKLVISHLSSGSNGVAYGHYALQNNTVGINNTAFGYNILNI